MFVVDYFNTVYESSLQMGGYSKNLLKICQKDTRVYAVNIKRRDKIFWYENLMNNEWSLNLYKFLVPEYGVDIPI